MSPEMSSQKSSEKSSQIPNTSIEDIKVYTDNILLMCPEYACHIKFNVNTESGPIASTTTNVNVNIESGPIASTTTNSDITQLAELMLDVSVSLPNFLEPDEMANV